MPAAPQARKDEQRWPRRAAPAREEAATAAADGGGDGGGGSAGGSRTPGASTWSRARRRRRRRRRRRAAGPVGTDASGGEAAWTATWAGARAGWGGWTRGCSSRARLDASSEPSAAPGDSREVGGWGWARQISHLIKHYLSVRTDQVMFKRIGSCMNLELLENCPSIVPR